MARLPSASNPDPWEKQRFHERAGDTVNPTVGPGLFYILNSEPMAQYRNLALATAKGLEPLEPRKERAGREKSSISKALALSELPLG